MTHTPGAVRAHDVRIQYFSGDEIFAEIQDRLELPEGANIEAAAAALAESSAFYNQRVPNISYRVTIRPADPDDPAPPSAGVGIKPICARCGAGHLARDACVRWDADAQCWSVSSIYDSTACDICGSESDDLAEWVAVDLITAPERFAQDLAEAIGDAGLARDPRFEQFCLDLFRDQNISAAEAAWKVIDRPRQ